MKWVTAMVALNCCVTVWLVLEHSKPEPPTKVQDGAGELRAAEARLSERLDTLEKRILAHRASERRAAADMPKSEADSSRVGWVERDVSLTAEERTRRALERNLRLRESFEREPRREPWASEAEGRLSQVLKGFAWSLSEVRCGNASCAIVLEAPSGLGELADVRGALATHLASEGYHQIAFESEAVSPDLTARRVAAYVPVEE